MLIIMMGQNCTGKSSITNKLEQTLDVESFSGKDYMRLAKNEAIAWKLFVKKLHDAHLDQESNKIIIYEVTEKDILVRLNDIGGIRIKLTADLEIIKNRFSKRMNGNLPEPVERMIKRKALEWEDVKADIYIDTSDSNELINNVETILNYIKQLRCV